MVPICVAHLSLIGMQQAFMHQFLDLLDLLDLLSTSNTTLDPIQHIYRHPNQSPVYYIHWILACTILNAIAKS